MRLHTGAASAHLSTIFLFATGCTVDVGSAPDRLVIDSESPDTGMHAHLVGTHQASITVSAHAVRVEDGTGTLVASLVVDPSTHIASGSYGGRTFGDDSDWRDTGPWQDVTASPTGDLVRAAGSAAELLLDDPAHAGSAALGTLAGLDDMLDQLSGVDAPAVPQDSCTDYWGCYGWCVGYYYDWYWEPHDGDWACSWYPMVNCDWCPWR
jgi:hypothetical protein